MGLSVKLQIAQKQKLVVTQTLREAIELLQISSLELVDRIEQELQENPVLELAGEEPEIEDQAASNLESNDEAELPDLEAKTDFDEDFLNTEDFNESDAFTGKVSSDDKQKFIEGVLQQVQTIHEYLINQLHLTTYNNEDFQIGEIIISYINQDGYLKDDIKTIYENNKVENRSNEDFIHIHELIKSFDPPGVAAKDLQESLLIQIRSRDIKDKIAENIIENYFDLLEKRKFKMIASKIGVAEQRVRAAVKNISTLEPKPGRQFSQLEINYVIPDIILKNIDGEFVIIINDDWIPNIRISKYYKSLLKKKSVSKKVKNYISDKFTSAQWLIRSISQRRSTLHLVMEAILEEQMDFFKHGPGYLKPLTLKDIAERIDMHESTVSRITSKKYVQADWGIFNLKYFFSSSIKKSDGSSESSRSVKDFIKKIIEDEGMKDNKKVYSDQDIVGILNNKGIKIARRTVAKYRKMLKILPSSRRFSD